MIQIIQYNLLQITHCRKIGNRIGLSYTTRALLQGSAQSIGTARVSDVIESQCIKIVHMRSIYCLDCAPVQQPYNMVDVLGYAI